MRLESAIPLLIVLAALVSGCDPTSQPAPSTRPGGAQASATTSPAVPTTRFVAEPASLTIGDKPYDFPPVKLMLGARDNQVVVILLTDDPPNAGDESYTGNSMYLEMNPEIPDGSTLAGAQWDYQAPNAELVDEVDGIYLNGRKLRLQPYRIHVEFGGAQSPAPITISGTFAMFDNDAADAANDGKPIQVQGQFMAQVKVESSLPAAANAFGEP